jgi:DNA-binding PadR family transcriptional regulator
MSTRLVLLGLLREKPLYGYEIKQLIEERMEDWTSVAFGSIYFALDKLENEGFIERLGVEQAGNRPARSVYQITDTGKLEFLRLLRQTWDELERQHFGLDVGIYFMDALPQEEIKNYLHKRIKILEKILRHVDEHQAESLGDPRVPRRAEMIFEHTLVHMKAELEWTRQLLTHVEQVQF